MLDRDIRQLLPALVDNLHTRSTRTSLLGRLLVDWLVDNGECLGIGIDPLGERSTRRRRTGRRVGVVTVALAIGILGTILAAR